jgi:hypothetical protein
LREIIGTESYEITIIIGSEEDVTLEDATLIKKPSEVTEKKELFSVNNWVPYLLATADRRLTLEIPLALISRLIASPGDLSIKNALMSKSVSGCSQKAKSPDNVRG